MCRKLFTCASNLTPHYDERGSGSSARQYCHIYIYFFLEDESKIFSDTYAEIVFVQLSYTCSIIMSPSIIMIPQAGCLCTGVKHKQTVGWSEMNTGTTILRILFSSQGVSSCDLATIPLWS